MRFAHCDVTKWDDLLALHELAISSFGTIDAVIANAGINEVEDIFEDKFDENGKLLPPKHTVNEVNLKGVFNSKYPHLSWILTGSGEIGDSFLEEVGEKGSYCDDFFDSRIHG